MAELERWREAEHAVRRALRTRVRDDAHRDDLVQETLARLLIVGRELDDDALVPYAVVTARNLAVSEHRRQAREDCLDLRVAPVTPGADDEAVRREEARALRAALAHLAPEDRALLVDRDVNGVSVESLARRHRVKPGALRARLTRLRADLRLHYALAFRHIERLPSEGCMRVLRALAAGDAARLRALRSDEHLRGCRMCTDLEPILRRRRRGLAGVVALLGLDRALAALKSHPVLSSAAAAGTAATVAVAAAVAVPNAPSAPPRTAPAVTATVASSAQVIADRHAWPAASPVLPGAPVTATDVVVVAVTGDESFVARTTRGDELDVRLTGTSESPYTVVAGDHVTLRGTTTGADGTMPNQHRRLRVNAYYRDVELRPPTGR